MVTIDKLQNLQSADLMRLLQGARVKQAVLVVNVLLTIWIAWILATLTWSVFDDPEAVAELPVAEVTDRVAPDPDRQKIREMPNWHLLGKVAREPKVVKKVVAPAEAPETRLKLVLRGAFASDDKEIARAIIADPRGQEEQYALGDKLPGNAELSEIHPEKVILMRNGRYETLRLPEERSSSAGGRTRGTSGIGSATSTSRAQRLKSMRRQLKQNPKSLYGLVRATPKKDEAGNMLGYTLQPGRDPELFQTMGLQKGDVVTGINEVKLDSLANGMKALKSAEAGESVTMTVLRNNQEETLTFSVPE
ncbi:MAG: type II secretion system protein GspC [Gammaproteobacteria bacterium]|nr:MAG: type II secretion system protein GspC [Gammaproteobacteria bacterium]